MPPGESIAIFDQDGTLRVKHPVILRLLPRGHDQRWSLDCVSDVLADGRGIQVWSRRANSTPSSRPAESRR